MSTMHITDVEGHLISLKDQALAALGADAQTLERVRLVDPPDRAMGDRGFNVGPMMKVLGRQGLRPPQIAERAAEALRALIEGDALVAEVIVAGPFVNLKLDPAAKTRVVLGQIGAQGEGFGQGYVTEPKKWMFEFSAPNTNKPQHLGHTRNNLLGQTVTNILEFAGHELIRVNLINDRGIHICKSMLAYQERGQGKTPESEGIKGDHFVGKYYVEFNKMFAEEYAAWQQSEAGQAVLSRWLDAEEALVKATRLNLAGAREQHVASAKKAFEKAQSKGDLPAEVTFDPAAAAAEADANPQLLGKPFFKAYEDAYFNQHSDLGARTKQMLVDWEAGDAEVRALWEMMNQWVFQGFDETYARMGVRFDEVYYESQTYTLGKDLVEKGLADGVFRTIDGGAIACDLSQIGLSGDKVLLRSDGTSVYMTQDLGTAMSRFERHGMDEMVYVVGDEQNHHFRVLFGVLGLLDPALKGHMTHLAYGMVELPDGKMKSREGRVVDADDLMDGMVAEARLSMQEHNPDATDAEVDARAPVIGMAGLKYFILDFTPATTITFDPDASIKPQGRTGPYCLYTYARIQSIGRELGGFPTVDGLGPDAFAAACAALTSPLEQALIAELERWPATLEVAARLMDPSKVTEYLFHLCKAFSSLYNDPDHRIKDLSGPRRDGLLLLCDACATTVAVGLKLLTIPTLDAM